MRYRMLQSIPSPYYFSFDRYITRNKDHLKLKLVDKGLSLFYLLNLLHSLMRLYYYLILTGVYLDAREMLHRYVKQNKIWSSLENLASISIVEKIFHVLNMCIISLVAYRFRTTIDFINCEKKDVICLMNNIIIVL